MQGKEYYKCVNPNHVALTFDDGPAAYTSGLLDLLKARGVKATFFMNGYNWDCIYNANRASLVQRMIAEGHQVASHTWDHADLTTLSTSQKQQELDQLDAAFIKIIGRAPNMMRPPYGSADAATFAALGSRKYLSVRWNMDSLDWSYAGTSDASFLASVKANINKGVFDETSNLYASPPSFAGPILLSHDVHEQVPRVSVPWLLDSFLPTRGLTAVPVYECLGLTEAQAYSVIQPPSAPDASWVCNALGQ